ncbi:MAG TPA: ABC transporter permease, partial [Bryobacteraceae bacterium]|nr:ABC transporter permease [Bryobacteraceae bacterium]
MLRDLLRALRWLRRNPLFTLAVTAILAVGIGANTAVFSIVDAVLLRPLPYTSAGRLVRIDETNSHSRGYLFHYADYRNWAARTDLFDGLAAHVRDFVTLTGTSEPDQIIASRISPGLFSLLGVHARLGRGLLPSDEDTLSAAVLSDRLWRRRFNADTRVLGRGIALSGQAYTIVGVMPPEFEFPDSHIEMWVPFHLTPASAGPIQVVGRMNPKVSL